MTDTPQKFEQWAIVEIFGHQRYAGLVTEQTIGGASFIRIDIPDLEGLPGFTKLFGASSIYAITPVSEETARGVAATIKQQPLQVWDAKQMLKERTAALPAPVGSHDSDDNWDESDDFDDA